MWFVYKQMRGNAGSHDLQLGTETLKSLRSLTTSGLSSPTSSCEFFNSIRSINLPANYWFGFFFLLLWTSLCGKLTSKNTKYLILAGTKIKLPRYNKVCSPCILQLGLICSASSFIYRL